MRAALLTLLVACHAPPQPAAVAPNVDDVAKQVVDRWNAQDARGVVDLYAPHMRESFPVEKETKFTKGMLALGHLDAPQRTGGDGARHGKYDVHAARGTWTVEIHIDDSGKITGLSANTPEPPVPKSTIPLGLPFKGTWLVFWGGDTKAVNTHVGNGNPDQRRAADLDKVDESGKAFKNDGKANADHFCFGAEVVAIADGTVTMAVDGVPDNVPGQQNGYFTTGNSVILGHTSGLWSVYGHLQKGSVRVKDGESVKRGAVLGLCGNSGNSSQPHLHFQLQDGPRMEASKGVEAVFEDVRVTRGGKTDTVAKYTFLKDDRIEAR